MKDIDETNKEYNGENNCISAGHIHVGGQIDISTARIATEESIRTLIDYIDTSAIRSPLANDEDEYETSDYRTSQTTDLENFAATLKTIQLIKVY